ncbi:MAG TPA: hypothetical protein VLT82_08140 [Myxococcaceae bacterium]|nr:hypothetical protein [Myxococcaceae bacterium]
MADAATTADAVRADTGAPDDHSFLWRRVFEDMSALRGPAHAGNWGYFVQRLTGLFQMRFGAVG